jgi:hydroxymethylpyrimidine pyrophosphatase-like HAD family hydrolase
MADIDLVVTDLDGTLWGADERIHPRTLDALRALEARGVPVLVATGRRLRSAAATLARGAARLDALVVLDGALGREVGAGRVFHRAAFEPRQAQAVLATFDAAGLSPCVYVDRDDAEVLVGPAPSISPAHAQAVGRWLCAHDDLGLALRGEDVLMFAIVGGDAARLTPVAEAIDPTAATAAVTRDVILGGVTLTVRPPGISKWQGVLAWCADQGLDPDRVLAVGDGQNDLELLAAAKVACVVADGCDGALALADHVVPSATVGGWAAVCDLL